MTLRLQVFLALACFAIVLTGGFYLYSHISFKNSFNNYVEQRENARNARLLRALERHYERFQSWRAFQQNPVYWDAFSWRHTAFNHTRDERRSRLPFALEIDSFPDFLPNEDERELFRQKTSRRDQAARSSDRFLEQQPHRRYLLLSESKAIIAGTQWANETYRYTRICLHNNENQCVGYLATPINSSLNDFRDNEFAKRQQTHFIWMAIIGISIALLCAIPLAYLLSTRVERLASHIKKITGGNYQERLPHRGNDELSMLADHLNHLSTTLAHAESSRRRWVADISHELRTPIAVLQGDLEAIQDGIRPLDNTALARLQKQTQRLSTLVNDLYQLSLTEIGALQYRKEPYDLGTILTEALASLNETIQHSGLVLNTHLDKHALPILADSHRLQQLFSNLLVNSIKYTEAPGDISVSLKKCNQNAIVTIEDSAPSVSDEDLSKLTDYLYRGESSRNRDTGGAGLGLAICKNIAHAHDATLTLSKSKLGGLAVTLTIPLQV
jgi:two-component system sensor histidine kinase BaeS